MLMAAQMARKRLAQAQVVEVEGPAVRNPLIGLSNPEAQHSTTKIIL